MDSVMAADAAWWCAEPDHGKNKNAAPLLRFLDEQQIPTSCSSTKRSRDRAKRLMI